MKYLACFFLAAVSFGAFADDDFSKDSRGCLMKDPEASADSNGQRLSWKGKCKSGYAEGKGVLTVSAGSQALYTISGEMRHGLFEGDASMVHWIGKQRVRSEVRFFHGKEHGRLVVHLQSGEVVEMEFVNGGGLEGAVTLYPNGDYVSKQSMPDGKSSYHAIYANGDYYAGEMNKETFYGHGSYTPYGKPEQTGEFILNDFIATTDDEAKNMLPAKFGLQFGMTREQVENLTGPLVENTESVFKNAYTAAHFPDEKIAVPNLVIGDRSVYFDNEGKLWRIWAEFLLKPKTYFGGAEIMPAYGAFRKWLGMNFKEAKRTEPFPNKGETISACPGYAEWKEQSPESFALASETAPLMDYSQRVIFDIACKAIPQWGSEFSNEAGERFIINIRDGNLYATPLIYTAATADELDKFKTMRKTEPDKKPAM